MVKEKTKIISPKGLWDQRVVKEVRRNASLYVLVAIPILFLIVFSYAPMYGVQIAFKDYRPSRGIWESEWVGLRYFRQFLETPNFWKILWNTISLNLYGLLTFPLGIITITALRQNSADGELRAEFYFYCCYGQHDSTVF